MKTKKKRIFKSWAALFTVILALTAAAFTGEQPKIAQAASYSVTVNAGIGGTVTGGGVYSSGTKVAVVGTPNTGYSFDRWTVSGVTLSNPNSASVTFMMPNNAVTLTASFIVNSYSVRVNAGVGGTVTGSGTYSYGTTVNISEIPDPEYSFSGWTANGVTLSNPNDASTSFAMPSNAVTLTANFTANSYNVSVSAGGGGTVSGSGNYSYGTTVNISATPNLGYRFDKWTASGVTLSNSNSATTSFTMPNNAVTMTASFILNSYNVSVSAGAGGTVTGSGTYSYGANVNISATPNLGYRFDKWTVTGVTLSNPNNMSTSFVMPNNVVTLTASFILNSYNVSISAEAGGTVSGSGTYSYGATVNISATPNLGYSFNGWTATGVTLSNSDSAITSFTMPNNAVTMTASFLINSYNVSVNAEFGGTVTGEGIYEYGTAVNISATPDPGYNFSGWTVSGVTLSDSNEASVSFTMPNNAVTLTASFTANEKSYFFEANSGPEFILANSSYEFNNLGFNTSSYTDAWLNASVYEAQTMKLTTNLARFSAGDIAEMEIIISNDGFGAPMYIELTIQLGNHVVFLNQYVYEYYVKVVIDFSNIPLEIINQPLIIGISSFDGLYFGLQSIAIYGAADQLAMATDAKVREFYNGVAEADTCSASAETVRSLRAKYDALTPKQQNLVNQATCFVSEGSSQTMQIMDKLTYMESLLGITQNNNDHASKKLSKVNDEDFLIKLVAFAIISLGTLAAYYFFKKRKYSD